MEGALAFAPFLQRHVAPRPAAFATSAPASYVVHRDSQHSAAAVSAYLVKVHGLVSDSARGREGAYFGLDLTAPLRKWSADERAAAFNPATALEIIDTPEVAINPVELAGAVRAAIAAHPRIEVHLGRHVRGAESDGHGVRVTETERTAPPSSRTIMSSTRSGMAAWRSTRPWD